jgi:(p)ppGpp synthase/HD superfamily hydrolase
MSDIKTWADTIAKEMVDNLNRNTIAEAAIMNPDMRNAIRFAIKTHEIYQKQKRKGKDIPYVIHPLQVGLTLALAGAEPLIVQAGILHDTIEDSISDKKVTKKMLEDRFGPTVAQLVDEVTEQNKSKPWIERKIEAIEHIKVMSTQAVWLKSADVICNLSEFIDDYKREGEIVIKRFNAPNREELFRIHNLVLDALLSRWEEILNDQENSMVYDLRSIKISLDSL